MENLYLPRPQLTKYHFAELKKKKKTMQKITTSKIKSRHKRETSKTKYRFLKLSYSKH